MAQMLYVAHLAFINGLTSVHVGDIAEEGSPVLGIYPDAFHPLEVTHPAPAQKAKPHGKVATSAS